MFKSHNGIMWECFIGLSDLVLVFWCHRKCPLVRFQSAPGGVPPFLSRTSLQLLQARHLPWWPMETSLLWHPQQIKVKHQTMQWMLQSTIHSPGCLPESRGPQLNKTKSHNMPPSMCPEHFWFIIQRKMWIEQCTLCGWSLNLPVPWHNKYVLVSWNRQRS